MLKEVLTNKINTLSTGQLDLFVSTTQNLSGTKVPNLVTSASDGRSSLIIAGLRRQAEVASSSANDRRVPLEDRVTRQFLQQRRPIVSRVVFRRRVVATEMDFGGVKRFALESTLLNCFSFVSHC